MNEFTGRHRPELAGPDPSAVEVENATSRRAAGSTSRALVLDERPAWINRPLR
jgi:hypothetical protein